MNVQGMIMNKIDKRKERNGKKWPQIKDKEKK